MSVFPLSRVLQRETFHSTGMSRFIARPGPVPLQSHHGNGFCYVARPYSGWHDPRVSLYARIAPLPLFGSMLSETPGARQSLSCAWTDAWLARRSIRSAGTQTFPFSGLCVRFRASTLHLAEPPLPEAVVPGGWIDLTREGFCYASNVGILSFSVVAQSLVN